MKNIEKTQGNGFLTVIEVAKMLGISRIAVFNKIKQGKLKAVKNGRRYLISKDEFGQVFTDKVLSERQKKVIEQGVKKAIKEYGGTLKLLGQE